MIIERDILKKLDKWKNAADRKPLIVQGARQIGKSWAVEEFGRRRFKHVAVFNFDKKKELKGVFSQTKDIKRLLGELELYTTVGRMLPSMMSLRLDRCLELQPSVRKRRPTRIVMKARLKILSQWERCRFSICIP